MGDPNFIFVFTLPCFGCKAQSRKHGFQNFIIERIEDLDVQATSMLLNSLEITPKSFLKNPEAYLKLQEKYISFGDDKFGASEYIRVNVYLTTLKDAYENGRLIIE